MADPTQPTPYDDLFKAAADQYGLPVQFVKAIAFQESGFNPKAHSPQDARGIMQMRPDTAAEMGAQDPWDPVQAIPAAARYLRQGYDQTGSLPGAAAYYHGGPDQRRWGPKTKDYVGSVGIHLEKLNGARDVAASKKQPLDLSELDKLYAGPAAQSESGGKDAPLDTSELDKLYGGAGSAPTAEAEKPPMAITVRPSGVLSNAPDDGLATSAAKNIGTGLVKGVGDAAGMVGGVKDLADYLNARAASAATGQPVDAVLAQQKANQASMEANATPIGKLAAVINPLNYLPSAEGVASRLLGMTGEYQPGSEIGKLAQAGARTITGAMGPGSVAAAPGFATVLKASPLLAASGAVGEGVADATGDPLMGLAAGAAVPVGAAALKGAGNRLVGAVEPGRAALAEKARGMGIPLDAADISDSRFVRMLGSTLKDLPMNGSRPAAGQKQAGINRAVAQTFGESADRITPQVMASARDRLSNVFETFGSKVPQIAADRTFVQDLQGVLHDAQRSLTKGGMEPLQRIMADVLTAVDPNTGAISGEAWRNLTSSKSALSKVAANGKSEIQAFANDIKDALNGAIERSAPPDVLAEIRAARGQWGNMRTVEQLVAKAQDGNITPALLQGRVNARSKGTYGTAYGGGGDLNEIAQMGQMMKEPPNSGTAPRLNIMNALSTGIGPAAAVMTQNPLYALAPIATFGGQALAGRALGSVLRSDAMVNNLIARSQGQVAGQGNKLLNLLTAARPQALPNQRR